MTDVLPTLPQLRAPAEPLSDFLHALGTFMHRILYMPDQASTAAAGIDALQFWEFAFFWLIGLATLGLGGWFAWRYRYPGPPDTWPSTPEIRTPRWLELGTAGVLLLVFLAFWAVGYRQYVDASLAPADALRVYVTGKQWVWKFAYPEGRASAGTLFVPIGRPVQLVLTSRDVIHSLFVPAFRLKQDAVPGRYTSTWFTATKLGRFDILCAEYCGAGHSRMAGAVAVLDEADFERWLGGREPRGVTAAIGDTAQASSDGGGSLVARGIAISASVGCLRCHSLDGGPSLGPTWVGLWGKHVALADGGSVVADEAYLTESMMDPQARIVAGFQPIMPTFQGRLAAADVAAILELIHALQGGPLRSDRSTGEAP